MLGLLECGVQLEVPFYGDDGVTNLFHIDMLACNWASPWLQVMGGHGSDMFEYFKILMLQGFVTSRKHMDKILPLVEIMQTGNSLIIV